MTKEQKVAIFKYLILSKTVEIYLDNRFTEKTYDALNNFFLLEVTDDNNTGSGINAHGEVGVCD